MLPASFYAEESRAKRQGQAIKQTRDPTELSVETWLGGYRYLFPDRRSDKSKQLHRSLLRKFRKRYGRRRMGSITAIEAQEWALKCGWYEYRLLRSAWTHAVLMQVVPLNVWLFCVRPKRVKPHVRPPTDDELAEILATCRAQTVLGRNGNGRWWWDSFADMIEVAAFTGARQGGLLVLRRSDVDLGAGRVILHEKGSKTRTAVLAGRSQGAMERQFKRRLRHIGEDRWRKGTANPFVFVNGQGKPLTKERVIESWRAVRGDFPHGFHSLRHYAATWLAELGVDPLDIAQQLGHTDSMGRPYARLILQRYDHPDPAPALERIAGAIGGTDAAGDD